MSTFFADTKIGTVPARRLAAHTASLVRVPAVMADQMRALGRNVLRELGQKIQRIENLEVIVRS
jgi:hypothetical protein